MELFQLKFLKAKWRAQHSARKEALSNVERRPMDIAGVSEKGGGGRTLAAQRDRHRSELWHILQINETKVPGEFTVFAIAGEAGVGGMRRFNLTVSYLINLPFVPNLCV